MPRITPACAGKRIRWRPSWYRRRDHPRLRGEKGFLLYPCCSFGGSPPLARGKGLLLPPLVSPVRITPACAGKSIAGFPVSLSDGDHPRLRGEKRIGADGGAGAEGSPPLARGKVSQTADALSITRITPACAGKSEGSEGRRAGDRIAPACAGKRL